jgi:hypothetical protein
MQNQISFSPGPWFPQIENPLVVRDAHELGIAVALTDGITEQQAILNGRLVAAAPDLLRLCEKSESALREAMPDVVRVHDIQRHDDRCFLCDLRAAIQRARGGL